MMQASNASLRRASCSTPCINFTSPRASPVDSLRLTRQVSMRRQSGSPVVCSAQKQMDDSDSCSSSCPSPSVTRRASLVGSLAAAAASIWLDAPSPAFARGPAFKKAGGIEYYDAVVGNGGETFDGDTIKITFTAHTFDTETGEKLKTFDPFINGGGGSSMTKGFKLTLGGSNGDVPAGLNLGIVGGDGVEPMQKGGKRILRIPPELAYGDGGHHCYLGMKDQCEVPPNTPVEIEVEFVGFV